MVYDERLVVETDHVPHVDVAPSSGKSHGLERKMVDLCQKDRHTDFDKFQVQSNQQL